MFVNLKGSTGAETRQINILMTHSDNHTGRMGSVSCKLLKLKTDKSYRKNWFTSINLLWSFAILGWTLGQIGPSFLDLQIITNTSLDKASMFFSMHEFGFLLGSLITGIVYDKLTLDKSLVVFGSLAGIAVVFSIIPWCSVYELMLFVHILKGIFSGGLETSGNAHLMYLWKGNCRILLQTLYFSNSVGGIISPYAMSPFLAPEPDFGLNNSDLSNDTTTNGYITQKGDGVRVSSPRSLEDILPANVMEISNISVTTDTFQDTNTYGSRLHIAYLITAGLALSAALPLLIISITSRCRQEKINTENSEDKKSRHNYELPLMKKVLFFIIIGIFLTFFFATFESFNSYLAAFCVKQMKWTKIEGSRLTSVLWIFLAVSGLLGILIIKRCRPSHVISLLCTSCLLSHLCFFLSAYFKFDVGIWISTAGVGLSGYLVFPTLLIWTNEEVLKVSGKVSSFFVIAACLGAILNPFALGPLIDNYSPMWLTYVLLGESIIQALSFFAAMFIVRTKSSPNNKPQGQNVNQSTQIQLLSINDSRDMN